MVSKAEVFTPFSIFSLSAAVPTFLKRLKNSALRASNCFADDLNCCSNFSFSAALFVFAIASRNRIISAVTSATLLSIAVNCCKAASLPTVSVCTCVSTISLKTSIKQMLYLCKGNKTNTKIKHLCI